MYSSVQSHRDDDARAVDARRFVAQVEALIAQGGPPRLERIDGPDSSGTAWAMVDSVGRFVDLGLLPGWWAALGPSGVAAGLLEALECARMKAALVPLILRRHGVVPPPQPARPPAEGLPPPDDTDFLSAARGRIADAYRLIDDADKRLREAPATRVITGPRGLFRLHVRGTHVLHADVDRRSVTAGSGELLVADARATLSDLTKSSGLTKASGLRNPGGEM